MGRRSGAGDEPPPVEILSFEVTEASPRELGHVRGRRAPRWLKLVTILVASSALAGLVAVFVVSLSQPHDSPDGRDEATPDEESATPPAETGADEADAIFGLSAPPRTIPMEASEFASTFPVTLLDGTEVTVPLSTLPTPMTVSLSGLQASLGLVSEACCARQVAVFNQPTDELFAGIPEHNGPDLAGVVGVRVFDGPDHRQLLALQERAHTIVVAAEPNRPFTPAELVTIRDLVSLVVDDTGNMTLEARLPLDVRLPAESEVATLGYSSPDGRRTVAVVAAGCADPGGGFDSPRCSVRHCPAIVRVVPVGSDPTVDASPQAVHASGGSCGLHDTSLQGKSSDEEGRLETQIVVAAGAEESGQVVAVDEWTGRMIWATRVGDTAHIIDVVDDGVLVALSSGRTVSLDVYTGAVRWTAD